MLDRIWSGITSPLTQGLVSCRGPIAGVAEGSGKITRKSLSADMLRATVLFQPRCCGRTGATTAGRAGIELAFAGSFGHHLGCLPYSVTKAFDDFERGGLRAEDEPAG